MGVLMKFLKIFFALMFVLAIAACGDKKPSIYDEYADNEPESKQGEAGDPCEKNSECKEGLLCIDKVCSEPASDEDGAAEDDTDSQTTDDADSDISDDADSEHGNDDTDTGTNDSGDSGTDEDNTPSDDDTDTDTHEYIPECGNGLRDPGEECDNGELNSDEPGMQGITCRTNCLLARCLDGIVDNGEICDDGNQSIGDYCSPDCQQITGYCGNGIMESNEICDPGIDPYCADDCSKIAGYCGDGIKQDHEKCDKAEPVEGSGPGVIGPYYCSVNCQKIIGACGDKERQLNEACDDGDNNGRYGYCNSTCTGKGPRCGDGKVDYGHENCDDGNTRDGDYCSADCQTKFGECGDGKILQGFEACDKANYGEGTGAYCSADCKTSYGACGDRKIQRKDCGILPLCSDTVTENCCEVIEGLETDEECDEGANNNNEYCPYGQESCTVCSPVCRFRDGIARTCGDGVVSPVFGERCDKATFGDGTGPYYCRDDCMEIIGWCGDGTQQPNEECDPAIHAYCTDKCKISAGSCGDGKIQRADCTNYTNCEVVAGAKEECDNGPDNGNKDCPYDAASCKVCTKDCTLEDGILHYCGNYNVDGDEACDDGPALNGTYGKCNANCTGPDRHCGDGNIDTADGETCDDGKDFNGKDGHCNSDCKGRNAAGYCGDGKIQRESCIGYGPNCVITEGVNETCDDGINDGSYGHCLPGCYGKGDYCGDNIQNGTETCDDGEDNGKYGKCKIDCSGYGERCGDGEVQRDKGETCDDGENNGKYTQDSPGYCNSNCDGYGEGGFCGDNTQNGTETCDWGSGNGKTPCEYGLNTCQVCSTRCRFVNGRTSYCGDGIRQPDHEDCDAGTDNGDYNAPCNKNCKGVPPKCGDGNIDTEFGEECDDKENNGKYRFSEPGYCNSNCQGHGEGGYCGDGERNGEELCDAGVLNGDYGGTCNSSCSGTPAYCGDGKIQSKALCTADTETLVANGYTNIYDFFVRNGFADEEDCLAKLADAAEVCDDGGNNGQYNKCNSDCTAILKCGDGITQSEYGEQCDSGDANGTTNQCKYGLENCELCNSVCQKFTGQTSFCGDETVDADNEEICDDGKNLNGTYGYCNSDCKGHTKCGDKRIQRKNCGTLTLCSDTVTENCCEVVEDLEKDEECDEGTEVNGTYNHCRSDCSGIAECGDGILQEPDEKCDNGFANGTYENCKEDCSEITGYCGDGHLQKESCGGAAGCDEISGANEQCDYGAANGITACEYNEQSCYVCTNGCEQIKGTTSYCGDGEIDTEHGELCDDGEDNGKFNKCDETCRETVTWKCGDGIPDFLHGEICDDGDGINGTYNHCNSNCKGFGEGGYCGDGITQQPEEECDDGANNNTPGFCNEICSGPTAVCGNGTQEYGETCDDGTNNNTYGSCNSDCMGYNANGYCGDGKIQKKTLEECEDYVALNPTTNKLCDENITENCCEVVKFAIGVGSELCDRGNPDCPYRDCGVTRCGDSELTSNEACDTVAGSATFFTGDTGSMSCDTFPQFSGGTVNQCNSECMPVLTSCTNNESYSSPFFNTGQTLCYNNSAAFVDCPADESDGFYGQSPQFSYLAQSLSESGGMVSESVSGLIWQQAIPDECADGTACTLTEAQNYCENLDLGGYSDWKLPSAFDFPTIANFETSSHLDSLFTSHNDLSFWAAEGLVFSTSEGTMTGGHSKAQVKCVRDSGSGTCAVCGGIDSTYQVLHSFTLITTFGSTYVFWYFDNLTSTQSWEDALATCQGININGLNKMRLPTVNELISLISTVNSNPLILGFKNGTAAWTSTTSNIHPTQAYVVDFSAISLTTDLKTNNNHVICVE